MGTTLPKIRRFLSLSPSSLVFIACAGLISVPYHNNILRNNENNRYCSLGFFYYNTTMICMSLFSMCIYNIISYYCKGPSQIDNPRISKFISVHFMMLMLHGSFILCLLVGLFGENVMSVTR